MDYDINSELLITCSRIDNSFGLFQPLNSGLMILFFEGYQGEFLSIRFNTFGGIGYEWRFGVVEKGG